MEQTRNPKQKKRCPLKMTRERQNAMTLYYFNILEFGYFLIHFLHLVSSEGILGSHLLKYLPWMLVRPFL